MIDVLRLIRFPNLVIAAAGVVAGAWIALAQLGWTGVMGWAALSGMALGAAGNALNDLHDQAADAVNRPEGRPVAAGRVSRGAVELCVFGGALIGLAAAGLVSGLVVLVALAALAVMIAYSPLLKRRGLPGNLAVAVVAGLPLFYGAAAVDRARAGVVPWIIAAWLHLAREIVKDVDDMAGDEVAGRRTLPIVLGRGAAMRAAQLLALGFVPLSIALPWAAGYGAWYFVVAAAAQVLVLVVAMRLRRGQLAGASGWLKGAMVLGLIALIAGRVA